jgi:PPM family protein phosphatase
MKLYSYTQVGKRQNNEDFLGHNNNTIIVCDGVGGHTAGDFASKFVVKHTLKTTENTLECNKISIQQDLAKVQKELNQIIEQRPVLVNMGTTYTAIYISKQAYFLAHIGDSRIYFVRPSENKIWHTWDHSLVGELMRKNEISREAGRHHPMGNRISRAIIANDNDNIVKADIRKVDEIQKGDLFFLCTDGVNEAWSEHELLQLLCNRKIATQEKLEIIKKKCTKDSKDNNTAYLVEIERKDSFSYGKNEDIKWIDLDFFKKDYEDYMQGKEIEEEQEEKQEELYIHDNQGIEKPKKREKQLIIVIVILMIIIGYLLYPKVFNKDNKELDKKNLTESSKESEKTNNKNQSDINKEENTNIEVKETQDNNDKDRNQTDQKAVEEEVNPEEPDSNANATN